MKKKDVTRREFLKVGAGAAVGLMTTTVLGCSGGDGSDSSPVTPVNQPGSFQRHQWITAVFETTNRTLFRQLLPAQFQMPDRLEVLVAVASYQEVTLPLIPYHEGFVMLLCKYREQECFYTVTMPVDDTTARDEGLYIGFPKYIADDIELVENDSVWNGRVHYQGRTILEMTFNSYGNMVTFDTTNPGISCVNLDLLDGGQNVIVVNTIGERHIQRVEGSATVTSDPSEPWSGLLEGATLITAQADDIVGNWTLTAETEPKVSPVSIVRIRNDNIDLAVEEAIALLGGIEAVTFGKQRIMLKPNLVSENPRSTTKPEVTGAIARLMLEADKKVLIGEGSAVAMDYNVINGVIYRTKNSTILDAMQQHIFDTLGYTQLAQSLGIDLVNLHTGEMETVAVPNGFVYDNLTLHKSLTEIDMLCSVPMMKTHTLAGVTLGMKNLIGVYPGQFYGSVRSLVHNEGVELEPSATAAVVVDMVRANKLGLVVIDGSMAMEGNGPELGDLVKMDLIIASTNPLAADMVAANVMGFSPEEIPTFQWANTAGMTPQSLSQIEIRGQSIASVQRRFARPQITSWNSVSGIFGAEEIP